MKTHPARCLVAMTIAASLVASCGRSSGTTAAPVPPQPSEFSASLHAKAHTTSNEYVFVTNWLSSTAAAIEYFPVGATGNVAPTGVIAGSNTGLTGYSQGVVVNAGGQIFVAVGDTNEIIGFAEGANGNVSPTVVIGGSNTGLAKPIGLALDTAGNIYVANCSVAGTFGCPGSGSGHPSIEEFAAGSNGNVAPIRTITGKHTQLIAPNSVAVGANGDIYVVDGANPPSVPSLIDVFRAGANGNVAPKHVIAGSRTLLDQAYGLAVTPNGIYTDTWNGRYIERFALDQNGDAAPKARIEGSRTELGCCLDGMAAAPDGSIYVADRNGDSSGQSVQQFAGTARGNVAPLTMIAGSNTLFSEPHHVFVGPQP